MRQALEVRISLRDARDGRCGEDIGASGHFTHLFVCRMPLMAVIFSVLRAVYSLDTDLSETAKYAPHFCTNSQSTASHHKQPP